MRSTPGWSASRSRSTLVTMESSGHYWMPLASHLRRRDIPVAVVNPLAAKYFAKSRLARTKSDPADARSLAEMGMRDTPAARDPLAGVELRQAARFAMTLVDGAGQGLPAPHPPGRARLPGARRAVRRPHLPDRPGGPAHRAHGTRRPPAAGRRRWPTPTPGRAIDALATRKAERLQAAAADSIAVPELEPEVAFEVGLLLDQYDLLERQIEARRPAGGGPPRWRARAPAPDHPGRRALDRGHPDRRDRRHRALRRLRPAAGLRRRPPRRAQLGPEGREPRDRLAHVQGRQQPPPRGRLPDGRRRRPAQPGHRRPLRRASAPPASRR